MSSKDPPLAVSDEHAGNCPRMKDKSNSFVFMVALLAAFEQFAVGQGKFATVKNLQTQYIIS